LLAQGEYAIQIGPEPAQTVVFQKLGYPVKPVFPTDGPDVLSGGYGMVCLMNKAPHPNAAKLFINWFAGRAAQEIYANATAAASLRNDVTYTDLPPYLVPTPGRKYLDTYDYKFVMEERDQALEKARALLGD
jgi:ABC-type Fe3+ transport system substrate-binding protein